MSKHWYVATTKPNGDLLAARELRKQGYVVYVAKTFEQQKDGRRLDPICRLRLPGYIFVAFAKGEHGPVNSTRGVGELLIDGRGDPEQLWPGLLEKLRAFEDEDFDRAMASAVQKERTDLREWDEVIITDRAHHCFGEKGYFMGSSKGIAKVLIGLGKWPVNAFDLKKVEKPRAETKPPKPAKKKRP